MLVDWEADVAPPPTYRRLEPGEAIAASFEYRLKDFLGFLIPGPGTYTAPLADDPFVAQVVQGVVPCRDSATAGTPSRKDLKAITYIRSAPTDAFRF